MTDNDKKLIKKAEKLHYTEWYKADDMAKEADTPEAKEKLEHIAKRLYHIEEFNAGIL